MLANLLSFGTCVGLVAAQIPSYSGFHVVWSDDFNGAAGSRANSANWKYATPATPSDGEVQTYTTSTNNAQLSGDGALWILPQKDTSGKWTSARLETVQTFQSKVGYQMIIEAQIRMGSNAPSAQQGIWPAFWALGSSFRANPPTPWPACGEWDIFEAKDGLSRAYATLHCGTYPGGICNEPVGKSSNFAYSTTGLHTYRLVFDRKTYQNYVDWPKQTLSWYIDGQLTQQITGADIGDYNTWIAVTRDPLYLIADIAVGGAFPGEPNATTGGGFNSGMFLHYVAVYSSN